MGAGVSTGWYPTENDCRLLASVYKYFAIGGVVASLMGLSVGFISVFFFVNIGHAVIVTSFTLGVVFGIVSLVGCRRWKFWKEQAIRRAVAIIERSAP